VTHFYDRRTGKLHTFPEPSGYRATGYDRDGAPNDFTVVNDSNAVSEPGDHLVRPELLNDPSYMKMMKQAGYTQKRKNK
jgi:hypothetical protein